MKLGAVLVLIAVCFTLGSYVEKKKREIGSCVNQCVEDLSLEPNDDL
jgi:hypothetical protein